MPRMLEPLIGVREPPPNRLRWTRTQCAAIRDAGILPGRYELIDGEIISKMGQKPPHAVAISLLMESLVSLFGGRQVRIQTTIEVGPEADPLYNEPEPDAAVTARSADAYIEAHPGPEELILVVEVSDTSLRYDMTTKAALYARAGIREYWVLDLPGRQLLVHRQPTPTGYLEVTAFAADERVPVPTRAETVLVSDLLPPTR